MQIVADGIVRVSTGDRNGSGFIYRVEDDGTVWVLTDSYLAGLEGNTTVDLIFASGRNVAKGDVRAIHEEKPFAIITTCCFEDATALPVAPTSLRDIRGNPMLILMGFSELNDSQLELTGSAGRTYGYTFVDGFVDYWSFADDFDPGSVGSPAFNSTGQVVGILIYDPDYRDDVVEHWLAEVDSESLPLRSWIDDSQRLSKVQKYDSSPPLPGYMELVHDQTLRDREANAIRIGANQFHDFAVDLNLPLPTEAVTIYTHFELSALADYWESEEQYPITFGAHTAGVATRNAVYLRALDPKVRLKPIGLEAQAGLLIHELTHTVFQSRLADGETPRWIVEGMAVYFSYLIEAHSMNRPLATVHQDSFDVSEHVIPPSTTDEFYKWATDGSSCDYNCGHAAVRLLASRVGIRGLVSFFENSRAGTPWQTTFEQTFGLTVTEFYDLFDRHIEAGFPVLQIPDDPFPEN